MTRRSQSLYKAQLRYRETHPWTRFVEWARRRCKDRNSKWFQYYGAKGIECHLNAADAKFLWERDQAARMQKPSLDRIESTGHYTRENCRFIEFILNSRIAWDPKARPEPSEEDYRSSGMAA